MDTETAVKAARVDFRLAAEQKEMIVKAAHLSGLSLSDFVVSRAIAAAAEVLDRQSRVVVSEADFARFVAALEDDGSKPTEAAKRASDRYNAGRMEGSRYSW